MKLPFRKSDVEYRLIDSSKQVIWSSAGSNMVFRGDPTKEDLEEFLPEDDSYVRLVKVQKDGQKESMIQIWSAGSKKRKGAKANIGAVLDDAAEPIVALAGFATTLSEATAKLYDAFHGGGGGQSAPVDSDSESPKSQLESLKTQLAEFNGLADELNKFRGYNPLSPTNFPMPQFNGTLPVWSHPWVLTYSKSFLDDVMKSFADAAQNFGYKFRKGISGEPPAGMAGQAASTPRTDATIFDDQESEKVIADKLEQLKARSEAVRRAAEAPQQVAQVPEQ
jgi:hypothetical protein